MPPKKKQKRKAEEDDEDENEVAAYTCNEQFDVDQLSHIRELVLSNEVEETVANLLSQVTESKLSERTTRRCVKYKPSKLFPTGRVYSCYPSLQMLKGWIRRIVAHKVYHDIDIQNAFPVILSQIAKKSLDWCPKPLGKYAYERSDVFDTLREQQPGLHAASGI